MNQDKQINIINSRKGTIVTYFSTSPLTGSTYSSFDVYPAFFKQNEGIINPYNEEFPIARVKKTNFKQDKDGVFIIGSAYKQTIDEVLTSNKRTIYKNRFESQITGSNITNLVTFQDTLIDDFYAEVFLKRTCDSLDTLSIKNNTLSTWPQQEANTGVVFGKLLAKQKILDENGEKVLIPLRNTPIIVFNSSDEFPEVSLVDTNGNRIALNLLENSKPKNYFNIESFSADTVFLTKDSNIQVPDKYKYSTITNENGEFILTDVPIGEQVLVFEIDLLKQGLTHDEVALNFFPYPVEEQPNIDSVPTFIFRQLPINVVPSWGYLQTGYTEVNVTINIDLRKWTTYYVPPVSYDGKDIETIINEGGGYTPQTVLIRDMSINGYPYCKQVVEISNMLDRNKSQQLEWNQEFSQQKDRAEFRTDDYHAFKVPANIYDPDGYITDSNGNSTQNTPMEKKGVWLSGYQLKLFYLDEKLNYRVTGYNREMIGVDYQDAGRSYFDLNRDNPDRTKSSVYNGYPYNKPWSANFPEKYSIPKKPEIVNPYFAKDSSGVPIYSDVILEQPLYLDGDLTGRIGVESPSTTATVAGGFGEQLSPNDVWIYNTFSQRVTKSFVYKYEKGVSWEEIYSNGYQPNNPDFAYLTPSGEMSSVVNGEKYQRVEAGYGYWLRPEGWPRVAHHASSKGFDGIFPRDSGYYQNPQSNANIIVSVGESDGNNKSMSLFVATADNIEGKYLHLKMDNNSLRKTGGLDIYRIINPSPSNLVAPSPPRVKKFVTLNFGSFSTQNGHVDNANKLKATYDGNRDKKFKIGAPANTYLEITNLGDSTVEINGVSVTEGAKTTIPISDGYILQLESNYDIDILSNSYPKAKYSFKILAIDVPIGPGGNNMSIEFSINQGILISDTTPINYYLISEYSEMLVRSNLLGTTIKCDGDHFSASSSISVDGLLFISNVVETKFSQAYFNSTKKGRSCPGNTNDVPYLLGATGAGGSNPTI
jgi:hypothetical protein